MATIKGQLLEELDEGDKPENLICFFQDQRGEHGDYGASAPIQRCTFNELPEREFHAGFGRTEGEPTICFSVRFVYIRYQYDGDEGFVRIPRRPESVTFIPWPGG